MRGPTRPFWVAQVVGWGTYGLILLLSSMPLPPGASLASYARVKAAMSASGFLTSLALWTLYERVLPKKLPLAGLVSLAAVASLAMGLVFSILTHLILDPSAPLSQALRGASNYGITLLAWSALYLAFTYRRQLEHETQRALRATAAASEAQLQMLRYQVHPHFLFNALNSIRALVDEDPARARTMITELAEFFRYSLLQARETSAPLERELEAIRSYLAIQKIRFEERLDVAFDVEPEAAETPLPGFLVHPLVENAVKYGMDTSPMPLKIALAARRERDALCIEVANTGRLGGGAGPPGRGTGTGLSNVRERLRQIFPDRHSLELVEENGWVRARLVIDRPGDPA